jgi:hypothetical protein
MTSYHVPPDRPMADASLAQSSHNAGLSDAATDQELCGRVQTESGQVCLLPARHSGSCEFDGPPQP